MKGVKVKRRRGDNEQSERGRGGRWADRRLAPTNAVVVPLMHEQKTLRILTLYLPYSRGLVFNIHLRLDAIFASLKPS